MSQLINVEGKIDGTFYVCMCAKNFKNFKISHFANRLVHIKVASKVDARVALRTVKID